MSDRLTMTSPSWQCRPSWSVPWAVMIIFVQSDHLWETFRLIIDDLEMCSCHLPTIQLLTIPIFNRCDPGAMPNQWAE